MKVLRSAVVTAAVLLATPVLADPPPLPVAVTFFKADRSGDLAGDPEALRRALIADNWFAETPASTLEAEAMQCVGILGLESCGRLAIAKLKDRRPPEVLVILSALPDGRTDLVCVGATPPSSGVEPRAEVDLVALPVADRTAAARCIIAAAAESGW